MVRSGKTPSTRPSTRPSRATARQPAGPTVLSRALNRLGADIVAGRYPAGSAMPPEPQLGEALGVSRTVVREAIKSLVAKGLISTGPKVGTRVLDAERWNWFDPDVIDWQARVGFSRGFMRELQDMRRLIEPAAVRMAAERRDAQDIEALEFAFEGMRRAVEDGGDYVPHDLGFHQGLLRACHNRLMAQMGKALSALLRTSFEIATAKPRGTAQSLPLHRAVLDAVIAQDPDAAERAALVLIDEARDDIEGVLASRRKLPSVARPATRLKPPSGRTARAGPRQAAKATATRGPSPAESG